MEMYEPKFTQMGEMDMTVLFKRFLDRHMGLQGWSDMGHVQAEDTLTW